jgi:hypothetical protein
MRTLQGSKGDVSNGSQRLAVVALPLVETVSGTHMTEKQLELLAKIVEGLLLLDSRELPRAYSTELLDAAHLAGVTKHLNGWVDNSPREEP